MPIYAKLNASMPWHDKIAELPSDSVRWAFVKVICAARQRESGDFSKVALTEALGTHAKHIPTLLKARLIDKSDDRYTVHDYDEHQSKDRYDPTAGRRNREYRARLRGSEHGSPPVDNVTVTSPRDVSDTSPMNVSDTSDAHATRTEQNRVKGIHKEGNPTARPPARESSPQAARPRGMSKMNGTNLILERGSPEELMPADVEQFTDLALKYLDTNNPIEAKTRVKAVWIEGQSMPPWPE